MPYDCFISYASADLRFAEELHRRLIAAGLTVWFDKVRLNPGCNWHREIETGCNDSRVVLPVLTPRWKLSDWTRYETYGAEVVIPVLFEGPFLGQEQGKLCWEKSVATPPLTRCQSQIADLTDADTQADWARLFASIRKHLERPRPEKAPRLVHLRYRPNPYFVGREAKLNEIHEKLHINPTTALTQGKAQAITALGGVGKTTLAREYAEKFWRLYPQMFWVDCHRDLTLEFAHLADLLDPDLTTSGLEDAVKAQRMRLELNQSEGRPARLLILDNADNEDAVLPWIPHAGSVHTIITSRFTGWSNGIEMCSVQVLEPAPAREFLQRKSDRIDGNPSACNQVAEQLGFLPLALEQAAAFIHEEGAAFSFADYLRLLAKSEKELLALRTKGGTDYPESVLTTWNITVQRLSAGARAILCLSAFLAPTAIPLALFIESADIVAEEARDFEMPSGSEQPSTPSEVQIRTWRAELARYSMVNTLGSDDFQLHSLVQAVERLVLEQPQYVTVASRASKILVVQGIAAAQVGANFSKKKSLFPHAESVWTHVRGRAEDSIDPDLLDGLTKISGMLFGDWHKAKEFGEAAWRIREARLGSCHPDTLISLHELATAYYRVGGHNSEAEELYRRCLLLKEKRFGFDHRETLATANGLADLLVTYKPSEANKLAKRAAASMERLFGQIPDTLITLSTLGRTLFHLHDYAGAVETYKRTVQG